MKLPNMNDRAEFSFFTGNLALLSTKLVHDGSISWTHRKIQFSSSVVVRIIRAVVLQVGLFE